MLYFVLQIVAVRLVAQAGMPISSILPPLNLMLDAVGTGGHQPPAKPVMLDHLWMLDNRSPLSRRCWARRRRRRLSQRGIARAMALAVLIAIPVSLWSACT